MTDLARAYLRHLAGIQACARVRPVRWAYAAAGAWSRASSPRRAERDLVLRQMGSCAPALARDPARAWDDYLWHAAANATNTYLYAAMTPSWLGREIGVQGAAHLRAAHARGRGVLVLSAHQHSLMLLGATLGLLGHCVEPIMMDPRVTAPDFLADYVARAIDDSTALYNGGQYRFVDYASTFVRPVYRALQAGHVVPSANDFPASLAPKRRVTLPFLGRRISCPTGSVEIAEQCGAAIVPGFVRRDGARLLVEFHPELRGERLQVMAAYGALLEAEVARDPGSWEGWKWPDLFDTDAAGQGEPS